MKVLLLCNHELRGIIRMCSGHCFRVQAAVGISVFPNLASLVWQRELTNAWCASSATLDYFQFQSLDDACSIDIHEEIHIQASLNGYNTRLDLLQENLANARTVSGLCHLIVELCNGKLSRLFDRLDCHGHRLRRSCGPRFNEARSRIGIEQRPCLGALILVSLQHKGSAWVSEKVQLVSLAFAIRGRFDVDMQVVLMTVTFLEILCGELEGANAWGAKCALRCHQLQGILCCQFSVWVC
mmetsp:Transcript_127175/g.234026  ORF Transcript_127175/g.234026 Transcript_127175/m.234026 type:complete len:240 (-) Transcript_127175:229-948(-)